ncbi:MAG TPA: hypothetical protein VK357_16685 [Rubrobacteraceae bacterium]|nr:hypothetical protein [Rubrobacteraceae bacterium]
MLPELLEVAMARIRQSVVYLMQVRAITQAAKFVREAGIEPVVEIMIPLVGFPSELKKLRDLI